jgi:hypothetical protein
MILMPHLQQQQRLLSPTCVCMRECMHEAGTVSVDKHNGCCDGSRMSTQDDSLQQPWTYTHGHTHVQDVSVAATKSDVWVSNTAANGLQWWPHLQPGVPRVQHIMIMPFVGDGG